MKDMEATLKVMLSIDGLAFYNSNSGAGAS